MGWFTGLPRWAQITLPVLAVAVVVLALVLIFQDDEDEAVAPTTTTTSTTSTTVAPTTTEAPTTTTAPVAKTVEQVAEEVRASSPAIQSGATGAFVCDASGTVSKGQVLPCQWQGLTSAEGARLQDCGVLVAILDNDGTWVAHGACDSPSDAASLEQWRTERVGTGLNCTDFTNPDVNVFYPPGEDEPTRYFYSLVYYFVEGSSPLLDIDNNGIPCETLFSAEAVNEVWAGGWVI